MPPTSGDDRHRLLPRLRDPEPTRLGLRCEQARIAAEAILETGQRLPSADDQLWGMRDPRDEYRCIPLLGATRASAAIPGTQPEQALLAAEGRRGRRRNGS